MTGFLSLLANLALIAGIVMYLRQVMKSESTPNPATWLIWLIIATMNVVSYWSVVRGDVVEWALTLTAAVGLSSIFLYALVKGKLGKVRIIEVASISMAGGIGVFWQTTGDAVVANLLLQVIYLVSFVPTVVGIARGELPERAPPWDLATLAYVLMVLTIIADWKQGSLLALAHPIANGIVGNGSVALTIRLVRRGDDE